MNERVLQKIGRVSEYLSLIESLKEDCEAKFMKDPIYRGALLHYLYLMADTCIALAEQVIRYKKLRPPQSYHEAFGILGEAGVPGHLGRGTAVIDFELAFRFAGMGISARLGAGARAHLGDAQGEQAVPQRGRLPGGEDQAAVRVKEAHGADELYQGPGIRGVRRREAP